MSHSDSEQTSMAIKGIANGWRYWRVDGGTLRSPVMGTPLPDDGTLTAHCEHHDAPPAPGCDCGIAFWKSVADMRTATAALGAQQLGFAITTGTLIGTVLKDEFPPRWQIGRGLLGGPVLTLPTAWRVSAYTVTTIYSHHPITRYRGITHRRTNQLPA